MTEVIEHIIANYVDDRTAKTELAELVAAVAEARGYSPDRESIDAGCRFIFDYIEQVPYMIKVARTAAHAVGLDGEMRQILAAVQSYWHQGNDVIPDHIGVIGILDDAYCSLTSMQSVSDHYRLQTGKFLFPLNLSSANRIIRQFIGEPYDAELDQFVLQTLNEAGIMDAVLAMATKEKQLDLDNQGTIWNHGAVDNMDTSALLALGLSD